VQRRSIRDVLRWCASAVLAVIAWVHTAFVAVLLSGIWWGSQKGYCPRFTFMVSTVVFAAPSIVLAITTAWSRSRFLASVPLIQWFKLWSLVLIAVGLVAGYASTATWLIPYC
jgi:hypothetical protein